MHDTKVKSKWSLSKTEYYIKLFFLRVERYSRFRPHDSSAVENVERSKNMCGPSFPLKHTHSHITRLVLSRFHVTQSSGRCSVVVERKNNNSCGLPDSNGLHIIDRRTGLYRFSRHNIIIQCIIWTRNEMMLKHVQAAIISKPSLPVSRSQMYIIFITF